MLPLPLRKIQMTENKGAVLLPLARAAIAERLGLSREADICTDSSWLHETAACFVTLHKNGALRGCIGSIEAHRPLLEDLRSNAVSAAFHDPRFPPLAESEFEAVDVEVSLLTPLRLLPVSSEADAASKLEPFRDGVVLKYRADRGTFLPQVWEQLPQPEHFLMHLKQKAGLSADFWHEDVELFRYTVEKYAERQERAET